MNRAKLYNLKPNPSDLELTEQLNPLHAADSPGVRDPELSSGGDGLGSASTAAGRPRDDDLVGEFLEEEARRLGQDKFDLRSGFYTKSEDITPRHFVDQEDLEHHRTGHFHQRHPMSIYSRVPEKRKKSSKSRSSSSKSSPSHGRKKKKKSRSKQFTPSMEGLPENGSGCESEGSTDEGESSADESCSPRPDSDSQPETTSETQPTTTHGPATTNGEGLSTQQPPGALGQDLPEGVRKLQDVLSITESTTDPDTDPGVHSLSVRRGANVEDDGITNKKHSVTFVLGEGDEDEEKDTIKEEKPEKKHHHRHHHHHHSKAASLEGRRALGSEIELKGMDLAVPTEQDEARTLSGVDLDDMTSHRLYETRGLRRRKMPHSHKPKTKTFPSTSDFDHTPHELFVEMAELHSSGTDNEYQWQDTARWIRYEEDVEAEATRYGKPHVASLSFHSLLELRKLLAQGVLMMDLDGEDLVSIINSIVDQMVTSDMLNPEKKGTVMRALLLKHKHVPEGGFLRRNSTTFNIFMQDRSAHKGASGSFRNLANFFGSRTGSTASHEKEKEAPSSEKETDNVTWFSNSDSRLENSGIMVKGEMNGFTTVNIDGSAGKKPMSPGGGGGDKTDSSTKDATKPTKNGSATAKGKDHVAIDVSETGSIHSSASNVDLQSHGGKGDILRRIPRGAEATTVLVGEVDFLEQPIIAFVRLAKGCMLGDFTEVPLPVRFIFILIGPPVETMDYHEVGRSISTLMANTRFHNIAYQADERRDLLNGINEFLDDSIVLPPGDYEKNTLLPIMDMAREKSRKKKQEEAAKLPPPPPQEPVDDPLRRTKKPFGGLVRDVKRRYSQYWSDIKDALNLQCVAAFFFIYFACLAPAITFGGLLSDKVDGWMGVSELLVMTSICGILFALLAGQPLLIVGFTGPIIVFEEGLFNFCDTTGMEYMPFRVWICVWVFIIAVIMVCFEGSFLVRYFTRFTQEVFAALISLIFIYETFYKLYKVFKAHPLQNYVPPMPENATEDALLANQSLSSILDNLTTLLPPMASNSTLIDNTNIDDDGVTVKKVGDVSGQPNTALLSLILCLGTFFIAYFLKQFRNSKFLGRSARRALGDFGVPIAIATMVLVDYLIQETYTQKLDVPDGIKPTSQDKRGWFIPPFGIDVPLPVWAYFAAALPGMLVFILIAMESQITGMIIGSKVKKGTGFHLDLLLIGSFGLIGGFMGLPLVTCATVRSVSHFSALAVYSSTHAPGEKPKLVEVKEQRLTGVFVHIMIGVSVLLGPVLRQVPLAVLFGVFLYMGVASMSGVQLFERVELFFMPRKHHPDVGYVKKVKTYKIHLFTLLQLVCLAVLWVVKSTSAALAFPFFLILLVPLRFFVTPRFWTEKELSHLDKSEDDNTSYDSDEDEPDFYTQAHMPI